MENNQIKSKQRVRDHGEVFTPDHIVSGMLDLVKNDIERIESRFLEPACGDGNFLVPVLEEKLKIVSKRYSRSQLEYERNSFLALASLYGIEILEDNVKKCRERLFDVFSGYYGLRYKKTTKADFFDSARFILEKNIAWGDALSLKSPDGSCPIVFPFWSRPFNDSRVKRHDYYFEELVPGESAGLFDNRLVSDVGSKEFIPKAFREFPLIHYLKIKCQN